MTARGVVFLDNWIANNMPALDPSDDPLRAYNLAARCIVEAAAEGITLEEINTATDGLETQILDAMAHLAEPGTPGD
jgi:hypothetical protein